MLSNLRFALLSGFCAAMASTCGKISGLPILQNMFTLRVVFFLAMILCNSFVWTFFVKALQQSESSLPATVTSSASNYMFSAFTGFLIFGEVTSLLWWSGMSFIMIGLLFILSDQEDLKKIKTKSR